MVLGLGKGYLSLIILAGVVVGSIKAYPYVKKIGIGFGEIAETFTGAFTGVTTAICRTPVISEFNPACKAEETTWTCEGGEFQNGVCVITPDVVIVTPDPVIDTESIIANCNPLDSCFVSGQQKQQCYSTTTRTDAKGNIDCVCEYDQQCENDVLRLECESQSFDKYWSNGQCKDKPTTEAIDDTTGLKVQDILEDKFIEDGGDLQKCKDNDGIVVGQYFSSHKLAKVVTTCVPKITEVEILKPTFTEIQSKCQSYCNENDFDIGSIDRTGNYCRCDGVPQKHLADLLGTTVQAIDEALR